MRNSLARLAAVLVLLQPVLQGDSTRYRAALPGYAYSFPRDHFNHPDFQTEWWYYTGNLKNADGHRLGFELTFFRRAVNRDAAKSNPWDVQDIYAAHLALSDLDGGQFYHSMRTNRAGPGLAGASESSGRIWNGNWQVVWKNNDQQLQAICEQFQLHLTMHSEKPPVMHGENGVSQKAEGAGHASHYISLTRLATTGSVEFSGKTFEVSGTSWMDHEFFTDQLTADQTGWDWLSIQLEDKTELMVFHIRRTDGSIDPFSSGTFVDANGRAKHLRVQEFTLQPTGQTWTSPATKTQYPIGWRISVPGLGIRLEAATPLASQEFTSGTGQTPDYWEGAIGLRGTKGGDALNGVGYLEMTGYDNRLPR